LIGAGTLVLSLLALLAAGACAPLRTFNTIIPKDGGTRRVAHAAAYGPDPRQTLDVYEPAGKATTPRPIIVFFYGGSWNSGDKRDYSFVGRALAARGFVTVIPDYRLVPGIVFPEFLRDGATAVRWVRAHATEFGADRDRIVLAGHSAGAYNAAMLAVDPQWLGADRAAVRGFVGLAGPYDFLPFDVPASIDTFSRWPRPEDTQPINFASADDPPALLLHGADDTTVLPRNSIALARKLREAGVDAEFKAYPKVGHAGIVTALAVPLRGRAPSLADLTAFARRVTH